MTTSLSWQEAVNASGLTPTQLDKQYRTSKQRWCWVLFIPVVLIGILMAMLVTSAFTVRISLGIYPRFMLRIPPLAVT